MKTYISIIIVAVTISLSACKQHSGNKDDSKKTQTTQVVYTCRMHPEVESDKPGDCPKCGMELVIKDEHNHPDSSANVDDEIK